MCKSKYTYLKINHNSASQYWNAMHSDIQKKHNCRFSVFCTCNIQKLPSNFESWKFVCFENKNFEELGYHLIDNDSILLSINRKCQQNLDEMFTTSSIKKRNSNTLISIKHMWFTVFFNDFYLPKRKMIRIWSSS